MVTGGAPLTNMSVMGMPCPDKCVTILAVYQSCPNTNKPVVLCVVLRMTDSGLSYFEISGFFFE